MCTEINYLERHGEQGRLDYAKFCQRQLPVGSGAIESAIWRVINLRMKGNTIFRNEENPECMLVLRGFSAEAQMEGRVCEDHGEPGAGSADGRGVEIARHGERIEGGYPNRAAEAPTPSAPSLLRRSCMTPLWE